MFTSLSGNIDVSVMPQFGAGASIEAVQTDSEDDDTFLNMTLRGMYMPSPQSAYGLFIATETQGDLDAISYGIEGGLNTGNVAFEAYYGITDIDGADSDQSIAGFEIEVSVGERIALGLIYDSSSISVDGTDADVNFSDTAVFASYEFLDGFEGFAEIGRIGSSVETGGTTFTSEDDADYIAVGATYKFENGAFFDARSFNTFGN
jgi:hypothetical protein